MATKKSTSKKATNKKATKKVAPKTTKHALIIEVSEKNGDCKNEFRFNGDLDIVAMAISKQAHEDENFRTFFYYLIKSVGKHSEKISKANKSKARTRAKKK
jgi:hypothetical protein